MTPDVNILENVQSLIKTVVSEGKFKKTNKNVTDDNDAPWFDEDCKKAKEDIKKVGKNIQRTPTDPSLRKILTEKEKPFRKLTREKKRQHEKMIFNNMLQFDRMKESKKFWHSLK